MLNKKGFTLVEILAVIVIIGIVATIGSVALTKVKKQMDQKIFLTKLDLVLEAAKEYGDDEHNSITPFSTSQTYMTVKISGLDNYYKPLNKKVWKFNIQTLIDEKYYETDDICSGDTPCLKNLSDKNINRLEIYYFISENNRSVVCFNINAYTGYKGDISIILSENVYDDLYNEDKKVCHN